MTFFSPEQGSQLIHTNQSARCFMATPLCMSARSLKIGGKNPRICTLPLVCMKLTVLILEKKQSLSTYGAKNATTIDAWRRETGFQHDLNGSQVRVPVSQAPLELLLHRLEFHFPNLSKSLQKAQDRGAQWGACFCGCFKNIRKKQRRKKCLKICFCFLHSPTPNINFIPTSHCI